LVFFRWKKVNPGCVRFFSAGKKLTPVVFGFFPLEKIESRGIIRFLLAVKSKPAGFKFRRLRKSKPAGIRFFIIEQS
jgi:hypothetical protein